MAFKMNGFSAFTKKTDSREYEDKVKRSDLDEEGKKIFDSKGYTPQTQRNKQGGRDMIPQTELLKMDLDDLEDSREQIFNNEYSDAKSDNDTSRIKLLEGRLAKLDKLIEEKRK